MLRGPAGERISAMSDAFAAQPHGASNSTADAKHAEPSLRGEIGLHPFRSIYEVHHGQPCNTMLSLQRALHQARSGQCSQTSCGCRAERAESL